MQRINMRVLPFGQIRKPGRQLCSDKYRGTFHVLRYLPSCIANEFPIAKGPVVEAAIAWLLLVLGCIAGTMRARKLEQLRI